MKNTTASAPFSATKSLVKLFLRFILLSIAASSIVYLMEGWSSAIFVLEVILMLSCVLALISIRETRELERERQRGREILEVNKQLGL